MKDKKGHVHIKRDVRKLVPDFKHKLIMKKSDGTKKPPESAIVFLVIKNHEDDTGDRPLENPVWRPQSIWLEQYVPGEEQGDTISNPQVGHAYRIAVRIHNLGLLKSYSTFVEFSRTHSSSDEPYNERIKLIGNNKVVAINAGSSVIVRSDLWVPENIYEGLSICARAYDPLLDPINLNQFNGMTIDRHTGKRLI